MSPQRPTLACALAALLAAAMLTSCGTPNPSPQPINTATPVPIIGGPCEGCEAAFQGLPDTIPSLARIAPEDEPGEPLRILGQVTDAAGTPAPGIIIYAYHTNADGIYPPGTPFPNLAAEHHGQLRAWARTDAQGRYQFDTIRPAGYPGRPDPQHVHLHIIEPGRFTYYIESVAFDDDPRLTPERRARAEAGRGGSGVTSPVRDDAGVWIVTRDITLGQGVPGYQGRE